MCGVPVYQTTWCHISAEHNVWCTCLPDHTVSHLSRTLCVVYPSTRPHGVTSQQNIVCGVPVYQNTQCDISSEHHVWCTCLPDHTVWCLSRTLCVLYLSTIPHGVTSQQSMCGVPVYQTTQCHMSAEHNLNFDCTGDVKCQDGRYLNSKIRWFLEKCVIESVNVCLGPSG
jgi:hypothetical protein